MGLGLGWELRQSRRASTSEAGAGLLGPPRAGSRGQGCAVPIATGRWRTAWKTDQTVRTGEGTAREGRRADATTPGKGKRGGGVSGRSSGPGEELEKSRGERRGREVTGMPRQEGGREAPPAAASPGCSPAALTHFVTITGPVTRPGLFFPKLFCKLAQEGEGGGGDKPKCERQEPDSPSVDARRAGAPQGPPAPSQDPHLATGPEFASRAFSSEAASVSLTDSSQLSELEPGR